MRRSTRLGSLLGLAFVTSACGPTPSGSDGGVDAGALGAADANVPLGDAGTLVGTFQLLHLVGDGTAASATASLFGKVYDGPTPAALVWEAALVEGDCRLMTPRVPFCATPCGGSAVCVENDTCQPFPASRPAGVVHASGVLSSAGATFDMSPIVNGYQPPVGITLERPPFADGAPVTLTADGSATIIPFSLTSSGVAGIGLLGAAPTLMRSTAVDLRWTPGAAPTAARVVVKLDISHHGGTKGEVRCDTDDDGALTLSSAMVTRLLDLGVAGYPTVVVRRQRVGSTLIAQGRVDLLVGSEVEREVVIPGLVSCTDNAQCTPPQTCQPDLRCQ